ncbi:hypothetical protein [Methylobacterium symbioticum]|jgi:hypothetical protein|uniref:Uncharacterized protein n=1 Tax=Methylobacterium symbioticum TaxID=2584084 RepID=A0A509EEY3_9HYPH|nr:hypothetical protein [Methylobacterium symbioticum]VUD72592.1 hypothetical protein MET9862_03192 [Methylobacterium symbioticum]
MRTLLLAAVAASLVTPALAQVVETPSGPAVVVAPGPGPATTGGVLTRQGGATGEPGAYSYSPTGQPADVISNDSAAAGNAGQPSRVAPQGSGGGGSR